MSTRLPCIDCLVGLGHNIKLHTLADILVLSNILRSRVEPIVSIGAPKNIFTENAFQKYLLDYLVSHKPAATPGAGLGVSATGVPEKSPDYRRTRYALQIPLKVDSNSSALLSLYYRWPATVGRGQVKKIVESLRHFEHGLTAACKELYVASQLCGAGFKNIVGHSVGMTKIFKLITIIAKSDASVLIVGETGTGKELIARAIHSRSFHSNGKFIPVDCVAIPANLIESELFGYGKGAFTGATRRKLGLFEFANHGTLFLDEISELDINMQSKLLRVLQERQFRRVGGTSLLNVNMRVIAAMNVKPRQAISSGRLRKDLYYRLNVIPIHIPPLRNRREDIPLLTNHFLRQMAQRSHSKAKQMSKEAMELLIRFPWSGNVRQLQNVIERISLLAAGPVINAVDLPAYIRTFHAENIDSLSLTTLKEARTQYLQRFEKRYLSKILQKTGFDVGRAARVAGVSARTIYRLMERHRTH